MLVIAVALNLTLVFVPLVMLALRFPIISFFVGFACASIVMVFIERDMVVRDTIRTTRKMNREDHGIYPDIWAHQCSVHGITNVGVGIRENKDILAGVFGVSFSKRDAFLLVNEEFLGFMGHYDFHVVVAHELGHIRSLPNVVRPIAFSMTLPLGMLLSWCTKIRRGLDARNADGLANMCHAVERALCYGSLHRFWHMDEYVADALAAQYLGDALPLVFFMEKHESSFGGNDPHPEDLRDAHLRSHPPLWMRRRSLEDLFSE